MIAIKNSICLLSVVLVMSSCGKKSTPTISPPVKVATFDTVLTVSTFVSNIAGVDNSNHNWGIFGMAFDAGGNLYAADARAINIKKITPQGAVATITDDDIGIPPNYNIYSFTPTGLAIDRNNNFFIGYDGANVIRKVTTLGNGSLFAGSGSAGIATTLGPDVKVGQITNLVADSKGNVYAAVANCILKVNTQAVVSIFAGSSNISNQGYTDGPGSSALFYFINGMAIDASDNIYVSEAGNNVIRKITPGAVVSTVAGNGTLGMVNGVAATAEFNTPAGLAVDHSGNIYVADQGNLVVRKITPAGVVSTFAGNGKIGLVDGAAKDAEFYLPFSLAVDNNNNVYVADRWNNAIRKITQTIRVIN